MKNIFDYSHVKSVSVQILQDKKTKELKGKIVSNWSDNPNGSVCTSQVILWFDSSKIVQKVKCYESAMLKDCTFSAPLIGKAGGYGYDKLSSAIAEAFRNNCTKYPKIEFDGAGIGAVRNWFEENFEIELKEII